MASITLDHVKKSFGETVALRDLSIAIEDKEFLVLVGPSGCGKSTLLRAIAGLEHPSEGSIYIGERLVNDLAAKDRDVAMVFQNYGLYPHMSVSGNLGFGLRLRHVPKARIEQRVRPVAELRAIEALLGRSPRALSGGQRQRVALGRAIVCEPRVFLMDEPLSNLDAKLRTQTRAELIKLHRRLQTTVVYVTHDQMEAMTMGDRVAVMDDGTVQQVDTPAQVYARPANMFVAGFIGSPAMNFFQTRLELTETAVRVRIAGLLLDLPGRIAQRARDYGKREVIVGIRPEDIHQGRDQPPGSQVAHATVDVVERLGSDTYLSLKVEGAMFTARLAGSVQLQPGDTLPVAVDAHKAHLFDPVTELAL